MSVLAAQVDKARRRLDGLDIARLASAAASSTPLDLSSAADLSARRDFLARSRGDGSGDAAFERIIAGNELQPINYLELGVLAARSVCRVKLRDAGGGLYGWATAFLIAPGVALTNNHVFPSQAMAGQSLLQFDVELDAAGRAMTPVEFALKPADLFYTTTDLDFAVCAVATTSLDGKPLSDFAYLPLIGATGKVIEGEWLTIIQHPGGEAKQVCVRENQLIKRTDDVLWYSTDTLGGSSGSPVFNNDWQVVALHHQGVPEEKNGVWQTADGRDFDPARDSEDSIKWIANEGIRVSRIVETLAKERPDHPLLEPVLNMSPERAKALTQALVAAQPVANAGTEAVPTAIASTLRRPSTMPRSITVTLDIDDAGGVSVRGAQPAVEAFLEKASAKPKSPSKPPAIDVPFDPDYSKRGGYDEGFLQNGFKVPLPKLGALATAATPLIGKPNDVVLKYEGYSVVMHKDRRFAIYSAANVDGAHRFNLSRPADVWRLDPRIPQAAQIGEFYYRNNQFDRGHLTRREDMEYGGTPVRAMQVAADTCHFTNCTPQHSKFNQGKELWQGLERHVLEDSVEANVFGAQVFTGPILDEGDPVWSQFKDIQYPVRYWKVAVALTSAGKAFAAAFMLDQSAVIAQFGIEAAVEVPFDAFKTYQVPVAEIERLTGLTFTYEKGGKSFDLSTVDPLATAQAQQRATRRAALQATEAADVTAVPPGYILLEDSSSIVRPES